MKIGILGGDLRNVYLANEMSKKGMKIYVYGLEKATELNKEIITFENIDSFLENVEVVVGPIPFEKKEYVNMPFSQNDIRAEEVLSKCRNKKVILGQLNEKYVSSNITDIAKNEEFMSKNAVATAEGTIQIILNNIKRNIEGSKVLVLGYGRCGKVISDKLNKLNAKVSTTYRSLGEQEYFEKNWIKGVIIDDLKKELKENYYDVIVNTIPEKIINKDVIKYINATTLFIDIASNPGGIDKEEALKKEIKVIHELGIPGKKAPETSAQIIMELVNKIIKKDVEKIK